MVVALIALALLLAPVSLTDSGGGPAQAVPSTSAAQQPARKGRAMLRVRSLRPLVVEGRGFKSGERVRVTGVGPRKMVGTTRSGSFAVRLPFSGTCPTFSITAIGSKGSRASINLAHIHCVMP